MNKTVAEAVDFMTTLRKRLPVTPPEPKMEIVIAPPFTALSALSDLLPVGGLPRSPEWSLAAQDVCAEADGAFTGEVSARMLSALGCRYVLVGHSERRLHFGETGDVILRKVKAVQEAGMTPVVCVGESKKEQAEGRSWSVIERQLEEAGIKAIGRPNSVMVAYEPVWAIGTGQTPHPDEIDARHAQIRRYLTPANTTNGFSHIPVLYGGSVNAGNVAEFVRHPNVDGVLVGGASLSPDTFADLIASVATTLREN